MKKIIKRIAIKMTSVKNQLTYWSCFLITYIVIKGKADFYGIALALCGVCLSYFAVSEIQKHLENKKGESGE
ncbi:MAG: hypothetical protein II821_04370 [Treponema sp.]|nr:hypothetical protein [Treponema sp.]